MGLNLREPCDSAFERVFTSGGGHISACYRHTQLIPLTWYHASAEVLTQVYGFRVDFSGEVDHDDHIAAESGAETGSTK